MKKSVCFSVVAYLLCVPLHAADLNNAHQKTTAPPNARFEIVVSQWLRRQTFKLDRFSGVVWQKVVDPQDKTPPAWERMPVLDLSKLASTHPHFELFLSGVMASDAYLLDTDSGNTWMLVVDKVTSKDGKEDSVYVWEPFGH